MYMYLLINDLITLSMVSYQLLQQLLEKVSADFWQDDDRLFAGGRVEEGDEVVRVGSQHGAVAIELRVLRGDRDVCVTLVLCAN